MYYTCSIDTLKYFKVSMTCRLITYQFSAIAKFILGFFLQNSLKMGFRPPDLVQKGVLVAPIIPHMATEVKWTDALYLLTHHLSVYFTCRIYFIFFASKRHKIEDFTPWFGLKTGFIGLKLGKYACVLLFHTKYHIH